MPSLGPFTVDTLEGTLQPAMGVRVWTVPPPGGVDVSRAAPVVSKIRTAAKFATPALAAAACDSYRAAVGGTTTFDGTPGGVPIFIESVNPDHMASLGDAGGAMAVCEWSIIAIPGWVPL